MKPQATIFKTDNKDPYLNIALEQWLLKQYPKNEPIIFLWQNYNSIIIGKNQNALAEINHKLVKELNIKVSRRFTGGGAVYQDKNNLCWTVIAYDKGGDYHFFTAPILAFLHSIGVPAEIQGRNDLAIDSKKISGTAQMIYKKYGLCHGTLLFDVDLVKLTSVLTPSLEKISSKGIESIRKRVVNIKEFLPEWTIEKFQKALEDYLVKYFNAEIKPIPKEGIDFAEKLSQNLLSTYEWNYGESKQFQFIKKHYFPNKGNLELHFNTNGNIIQEIEIYGDFLGFESLESLKKSLVNITFKQEDVLKTLKEWKNKYASTNSIKDVLGAIELEDFIFCMFK